MDDALEIFSSVKNTTSYSLLCYLKLAQKEIGESTLRLCLEGYDYKFVRAQARYFIEDFSEDDGYEIMERLKCVFGIYSLSFATKVPTNFEGNFVEIKDALRTLAREINDENTIEKPTFRVTVKRADKRIPMKSSFKQSVLRCHLKDMTMNLWLICVKMAIHLSIQR